MALLTVFSSNLNPVSINLTSRFKNGKAFYIDAPLIAPEMEIDCFLQIYIPTANQEIVRNIPIHKVSAQNILLNRIDTETIIFIPDEYQDSGYEIAIAFLASEPVYLEVFVFGANCTLCQVNEKLDAISETLEQIVEATNNNDSSLLLNLTTQLLEIDAGLFTLAQGLALFLPDGQRQNFGQTILRRLNLNRNYL